MFTLFAKRIPRLASIALLFLLLGSPGLKASTAKGGSLGVRTNDGRKHFTLSADATWLLNVKERFDASALTFHHQKLLTINDRDGGVYQITLRTNATADVRRSELFSRAALLKTGAQKSARYDNEGLAADGAGHLYLSEESQRVVFKSSLDGKTVEALKIDWSPVRKFFSADRNASFEGIAVSDSFLYLANERSSARIIVVDLTALKVVDSFFVDSEGFAFGGPHYSDLAFAGENLFILDRNHRCIFEVDPKTKRVLSEYSYAQMELGEQVAYQSDYPTGAMEGLAIDNDFFWLITDNNGKGRFKFPGDSRPTLFRCKRPK